jgi:hypothetical protein
MMLLMLLLSWELKLQTQVVRLLEQTLQTRSVPAFRNALLRSTLVSVFGAARSIAYGYMQVSPHAPRRR